MAITKINNKTWIPSLWINQFWIHHCSFNTKLYREFWVNIFGCHFSFQQAQSECISDPQEFDKILSWEEFECSYKELFNSYPWEYLWSKEDFNRTDYHQHFVSINLLKTVLVKQVVKNHNDHTARIISKTK